MSRRGFTLIELLIPIFVVTVSIVFGKSVASAYGASWGTGAGILAGLLSVIIVVLFYRWSWRRDKRRLQELREKYRAVYRVVAVPSDPKTMIMPEGAEIRIGDYGWEAGQIRSCSPWSRSSKQDEGLIYLQGLTLEWTVVWHAGFRPDQIERVATKPNSQFDSWHPDWAVPPPLPPCPFPVIERETLTIGRPHHSHCYCVMPAPYPTPSLTIPVLELDPPDKANFPELSEDEAYRILGANVRRGRAICAVLFFLTVVGIFVAVVIYHNRSWAVTGVIGSIAFGVLAMLIQRNLKFVHRIAIEPRLVHRVHARRWPDRDCDVLLSLHSRTDKTLEVPMSREQMIRVVAWLRRHNPDIRCGA